LKYAQSFHSDREVVFEAVSQTGRALEFASEELQADKQIVLQAVRRTGCGLAFAAEDLRADRQCVLEAVSKDGDALQYAAIELQLDRACLLRAFEPEGAMAVLTSDWFREIKPCSLSILKKDRDFLEEVIEACPQEASYILHYVGCHSSYVFEFSSVAGGKKAIMVVDEGSSCQEIVDRLLRKLNMWLLARAQTAHCWIDFNNERIYDDELVEEWPGVMANGQINYASFAMTSSRIPGLVAI